MTKNKARRLLEIRAELGIDQWELAKEARLTQPMISRIENNKEVYSERTALRIFYAVNRLRRERGWPDLEFDEIRWNLRHNSSHEGDDNE